MDIRDLKENKQKSLQTRNRNKCLQPGKDHFWKAHS